MADELLLGPIVEITISKVISVAEEQINLVVGYKKGLKSFCRTLEMFRAVLLDASELLPGDPRVSVWLKELRKIADEADAVLDDTAYENLQHKLARKQILKQVRYFFTPSNPLAVRRRMASKINNLNAALAKLMYQVKDFGLQHTLATTRGPEPRGLIQEAEASLGDSPKVFGRDGDVKEIVRLLVESGNDQPLAVVSIVGLGGLGKTTLAKLVCNNEEVKENFSKIIWVCVSEDFDVLRILVEMLEALSHDSIRDITNQDVANKIKEELKGKNFLLVLDDVWNEDEQKWENLRNCLMGITQDVNRSRVLVTTRSSNVASIMGSLCARIDKLSDGDCWSIIKERAFNKSPVPLELEEIGMKIAMKCRGVPLVAYVVGGTLCGEKRKDKWLAIAEPLAARGQLDDNNGFFQTLKLSFDRLPGSALKQGFAFCSVSPKDFVMEKEMLVQVWMAHGLLQRPHGSYMEMEDLGDKYFMELVSYSLLKDVERDYYGRIISCKMHHLIHDLAKRVSNSETLIVDESNSSNTLSTRHLNLICAPSIWPSMSEEVIQEVHSLFSKIDVFSHVPVVFESLLVLNFRGADIDHLPSFLGKLMRLRYLDFSETSIKEIPLCVSDLLLLQTFRFMNCRKLERPFEGIRNLMRLKHIYFDDEKLTPTGIGSLTGLQTLRLFGVGCQTGRGFDQLKHLSELRGDLRICGLENVKDRAEAMEAKLWEKPGIVELILQFNSEEGVHNDDDDDVLEGLRPHSNLKGLILKHYGGENCPSWMSGSAGYVGGSFCLGNLVRMDFSSCYHLKTIPSVSLSNLVSMSICYCGELESIASLSLNKEARVEISNCSKLKNIAVSSIQSLEIQDCVELVDVHLESRTIESLQKIDIRRCSELISLPLVGRFRSLKILRLEDCKSLRSIGDNSTSWSLVESTVRGCPNLISMPSFDKLSPLETISISHSQQLQSIGWEKLSFFRYLKHFSIQNCHDFSRVPSLHELSSLETLRIKNCQQLKTIEGERLSASVCLVHFSIQDCPALMSIPSLDGLSSLQTIRIEACQLLQKIDGESLSSLRYLVHLSIQDCPLLEFIPSLDGLSSVQTISLKNCQKLSSIGKDLSSSTCLESLSIFCCQALTSIPRLDRATSLQKLCIRYCGLSELPVELSSLLHLFSLEFGGFSKELEEFPGLGFIQDSNGSLEDLTLVGWEKLKLLPDQIQYLTGLTSLTIEAFEGMEDLPDWLGELSSLQTLRLSRCNSLRRMPSIGAMQKLSKLDNLEIISCPKLEVVNEADKIFLIRRIVIDDELI